MARLLDYAGPRPKATRAAVCALVVGLLSGPVACTIAMLCAENHWKESTKECLGIASFISVLAGSLAFSLVTRLRLTSAPRRDRVIANVAIAAPVAWGFGIVALFVFLLSRSDL